MSDLPEQHFHYNTYQQIKEQMGNEIAQTWLVRQLSSDKAEMKSFQSLVFKPCFVETTMPVWWDSTQVFYIDSEDFWADDDELIKWRYRLPEGNWQRFIKERSLASAFYTYKHAVSNELHELALYNRGFLDSSLCALYKAIGLGNYNEYKQHREDFTLEKYRHFRHRLAYSMIERGSQLMEVANKLTKTMPVFDIAMNKLINESNSVSQKRTCHDDTEDYEVPMGRHQKIKMMEEERKSQQPSLLMQGLAMYAGYKLARMK